VLRIIDVFERPDHIRTKLEDWLRTTGRGGISILATILRKVTIRKLWKQAAILCDADRCEVLSPQDLDCHCVMRGTVLNHERASSVAKLLPFGLYGEDAYLLFKAAARWSLASHARQHSIVFDLCESEAAKRTGRCRILLLEIVAYVSLDRQDLERGFLALNQSLTPDPPTELAKAAKVAAEWERLLRLTSDPASPDAERPPSARDAALRCVLATQAADTYRTKRIIRRAERQKECVGDIVWDCEFARPTNFHVSQTMWWESGPVYDEWITVGRTHFRGPAYLPTRDYSKKTTSTLLASGYFRLLRKQKPAAFDVRFVGDRRYMLFQYENVPAPTAPLWGSLAHCVGVPSFGCDVLVWADGETGRLVKVVQVFKPSSTTGDRMEIVHLFSGYDEPVSIVPPAFSLLQPSKRRLTEWFARRWC
jgi:hypothetical protein